MEDNNITTLMDGVTDNTTNDAIEEASKSNAGLIGICLLGGAAVGAGVMFLIDKYLFKKQINEWMDEILEGYDGTGASAETEKKADSDKDNDEKSNNDNN